MDNWQNQLRDALEAHDEEKAKNILFAQFVQQSTMQKDQSSSSETSSLINPQSIQQVLNSLSTDCQSWLNQQVQSSSYRDYIS